MRKRNLPLAAAASPTPGCGGEESVRRSGLRETGWGDGGESSDKRETLDEGDRCDPDSACSKSNSDTTVPVSDSDSLETAGRWKWSHDPVVAASSARC